MKQQQEKTKNKEKKTREIAARARKIKKDHEAQKAKEAAEEVARQQQQHNERERKDRLLFGGSRADGCRAGKFSYHLFTYVFTVVLFQTKENVLGSRIIIIRVELRGNLTKTLLQSSLVVTLTATLGSSRDGEGRAIPGGKQHSGSTGSAGGTSGAAGTADYGTNDDTN